jgi:LuxR family transcriptional regulator, maltose regulon positive regulatory protein
MSALAWGEPALHLRLFGPLRAEVNGRVLIGQYYDRTKVKALLAYLYLRRDRYISRDQLLEDLWPDMVVADSGRLKQAVLLLRRVLEDRKDRLLGWRYIREYGGGYYFNPDAPASSDVEEFRQALTLAQIACESSDGELALRHYSHALALHEADFLPEFQYENWATAEAHALHELYLRALEDAARIYGSRGEYGPAVRLLTQAIDADPLRETAYSQLMDWLRRQHDHVRAVRVYLRLKQALAGSLQLEPSPEVTALYESIRRDRASRG